MGALAAPGLHQQPSARGGFDSAHRRFDCRPSHRGGARIQCGAGRRAELVPFSFCHHCLRSDFGFHGLVASGTTSKQVACATDARTIGYGAMLGEGALALLATLAVSAGLSDWASHYQTFALAAKDGVTNFVVGAATFLGALGIPRDPAEVVVAVLVISFAATSLDTGVRIERYILHELGETHGISALKNRYIAGAIAVSLPLALILAGRAGQLWQLFGSSNQLLAGLSLTVVVVWQVGKRRPWAPLAVPAMIVMLVSGLAMALDLAKYLHAGNYLLASLGAVILALQVWVAFEAVAALRSLRSAKPC